MQELLMKHLLTEIESFKYWVGIDEAGYGSWIGPLMIGACVVWDRKVEQELKLKDSKKYHGTTKLTAHEQRKIPFDQLQTLTREKRILTYCQTVSLDDINKSSNYHAELAHMEKLMVRIMDEIKEMDPKITNNQVVFLIDGNNAPSTHFNIKTIPKGDSLFWCISAASILAKVTHDDWILTITEQYPGWDFHKNQGYGNPWHCRLVKEFQIFTDLHRTSFGALKKHFYCGKIQHDVSELHQKLLQPHVIFSKIPKPTHKLANKSIEKNANIKKNSYELIQKRVYQDIERKWPKK